MADLKTLKDIANRSCDKCIADCNSDELKEEAIKWIKHIKECNVKMGEVGTSDLDFIENFFNITGSDFGDDINEET